MSRFSVVYDYWSKPIWKCNLTPWPLDNEKSQILCAMTQHSKNALNISDVAYFYGHCIAETSMLANCEVGFSLKVITVYLPGFEL